MLAALTTACAPVLIGAVHVGNTTPPDLLAWTAVVLCVSIALLRNQPRWWLAAGVVAGSGLENENLLILLLLIGLAAGLLTSEHRSVLRTSWPWLGAGIAAAIWAPNVIWQATHGWPQLTMASALHQQNNSLADYAGGLPAQFVYLGLLVAPLVVVGFIRLWRTPELRFVAVSATLIVLYVLVWVPGKTYYAAGVAPAVLAAGSLSAERWIARARRPRLRLGVLVAASLLGMAAILPDVLPVVPIGDVHDLPSSAQHSSAIGDTIGWPQLTRAVAGYYAEAGALDVLGGPDHLPPVLSGHNSYWMWGPGQASDRTVLVVDALGPLKPYFASCRLLSTYYAPYDIQNDWTGLQIGVCTGPVAGWPALWPHLKHYG